MTHSVPEGYVVWEGPVVCRECGASFPCEIAIPEGRTWPGIAIQCPGCWEHSRKPLLDPRRN